MVVLKFDEMTTVVGAPETVNLPPFLKGSITVLYGKNSE